MCTEDVREYFVMYSGLPTSVWGMTLFFVILFSVMLVQSDKAVGYFDAFNRVGL